VEETKIYAFWKWILSSSAYFIGPSWFVAGTNHTTDTTLRRVRKLVHLYEIIFRIPNRWVSGAISPEIKWPGREADHSRTSSAEVKNVWSYTSTRLHGVQLNQVTYVFMTCYLSRGTTLPSPYLTLSFYLNLWHLSYWLTLSEAPLFKCSMYILFHTHDVTWFKNISTLNTQHSRARRVMFFLNVVFL
jgi:hypothetical protein